MKLTPIDQPLDSLHHYRGTGFPNGKVAAPVGSIYTDTAATSGAIRWIKTTGTGNTGWQVEYGDTGRRLLGADLYGEGWGPYSASANLGIWVRRINNTVHFGGYLTKHGDGTDTFSFSLGFRPSTSGHPFVIYTTLGVAAATALPQAVGALRPNQALPNAGYYYPPGSFITANAWPATLPGTPA